MIQKFSLLSLAAGALLAGAIAAPAATLDLTDNTSYTTQTAAAATGTFLGIDWKVTSTPANQLTYTSYDAWNTNSSPLTNDNDGIGVGNDEVGGGKPVEQLIIDFKRTVVLTGIHVLDMFTAVSGTSDLRKIESVKIFGAAHNLLAEVFATTTWVGNTSYDGYVTKGFAALTGKTFIFEAGLGNDARGRPDFALAGLEVEPENTGDVPLPAGGVLLLTALGGLGLARRRSKV